MLCIYLSTYIPGKKEYFGEAVFIFSYSYICSESKNITGETLLTVEPGGVCCASYTAFSFIFKMLKTLQ